MKIAIRGHESRGKEVIQILESLGGKNDCPLTGKDKNCYYYICNDSHKGIRCHDCNYVNECKKYTLEEFEKEFPFKVGDKVIYDYTPNYVGTIVDIKFDDNIPYRIDIEGTVCTCGTFMLKSYKEMKEERNITLTLDKAKEWYKKGGELKEIALQAFTEKELTKVDLPKTWEEFCDNYPMRGETSYIDVTSDIKVLYCCDNNDFRDKVADRNICLSKKSAKAHLAMIQLEQLRDCWRQGWKPNWNDGTQTKYCVRYHRGEFKISMLCETNCFLSFPTEEMAEEFIDCFRNLIEQAGDLI